ARVGWMGPGALLLLQCPGRRTAQKLKSGAVMVKRRAGPSATNVPNIMAQAASPIMLRQKKDVWVCFGAGSSIRQKAWKNSAAGTRNAATISAPTSGQMPSAIDAAPAISHTPTGHPAMAGMGNPADFA